jgi:Flp pilus assembly pilin Flp
MRKLNRYPSGQSIVEYVVLLALVSILIVTVVAGIGQRSRSRVAQANEALDEAAIASSTSSSKGGKPAVAGIAAHPKGREPKDD